MVTRNGYLHRRAHDNRKKKKTTTGGPTSRIEATENESQVVVVGPLVVVEDVSESPGAGATTSLAGGRWSGAAQRPETQAFLAGL